MSVLVINGCSTEKLTLKETQEEKGFFGESAVAGQAIKTSIQCNIVGDNLVLSRGDKVLTLSRFFCSPQEGNAQRERICATSGYTSSLTLCPNGCDSARGRCISLCGNGMMDAGENCAACPADVQCAAGELCQEGVCVTQEETITPPEETTVLPEETTTPLSSDSCTTPPSGAVAFWPADGNGNDIINFNDGILLNGAYETGRSGGQAFSFSGTSLSKFYVADSGENTLLDLVEGITVSAWVNTADGSGTIVSKGDRSYYLSLESDRPKFTITSQSGARAVQAPPGYTFPDNEWVLITGAADANNQALKLYVNGVLINTNNADVAVSRRADNGPLIMGELLVGFIDDVILFNQELSEAQVQELVNTDSIALCRAARFSPTETCVPAPSGTIAWWPGNMNTQDVIGDHDGLLLGNAAFAAGRTDSSGFSFSGSSSSKVHSTDPGENSPLDLTGDMTVSAWVNTADGSGTIVSKGDRSYYLSLESDRPKFTITSQSGARAVQAPPGYTFPDNEWVLITGAADANNQVLKVYVNGALAGSAQYETPLSRRTDNNPLIIGHHLEGIIEDPLLVSRILSTEEIRRMDAGEWYCVPTPVAPAASCITPFSGMVSWWPGDGNANDIEGSNDGIVISGITFEEGQVASSFSASGSSSARVEVPDADSLDLGGDMTVSAWVKTADGSGTLIRKGGSAYYLSVSGDSPRLTVTGTTGRIASTPPGYSLPDNQWVLITGTTDTSNRVIKIYINDILANVAYYDAQTRRTDTQALTLGDGLDGNIDEIILLSRILTKDEISTLFQVGSYGMCK